MTDTCDQPFGARKISKLFCLGRCVGQRLLAIDVLSGKKSCLGHGVVQAVRQADVNQVNLRIIHRILPVGQNFCTRRTKAKLRRRLRIAFHQSCHAGRATSGAKELRKGLECHGVHLAHPS
jgi:hypothetical protein